MWMQCSRRRLYGWISKIQQRPMWMYLYWPRSARRLFPWRYYSPFLNIQIFLNIADFKGRHWNETTCQCQCLPLEDVPQCGTGSKYDLYDSCTCISTFEYASPVLIITCIILIVAIASITGGIIHCHRKNIGFFSHRRRESVMEQIRRRSSTTGNSRVKTVGGSNLPLMSP